MAFNLTESDLSKITKSLSFLMDNNNPLYLKKGKKQNFLRVEASETDEYGDNILMMSGTEFELDTEVPYNIFVRDGKKLVSNLKLLNNPELKLINNNDGSSDLKVSEGNYFNFTIGLSDEENIFKIHGNNLELIEKHKKYLDIGIVDHIKNISNMNELGLFLRVDDLDKIKKFCQEDFVSFTIKNGKCTAYSKDKETNNGFELLFQEIEDTTIEISFSISLSKISKLDKSSYNISVYYLNNDVASVIFKSVDEEIKYILPLIHD